MNKSRSFLSPMEPPPKRVTAMEDVLEDLENAAKIPATQRAIKISTQIERVCSRAYEDGLSNASLERLIDTTTLPNKLDQASINNLIKNLYPVTKIPNSIVVKVVGSLGHGKAKPSYSSQAALLRWLVMVHSVLETPKILSQLYGIIFNLLDTSAIRPQLCHLLSLITRRKHVLPYRIQLLMKLTRQAGNEPPLVGLMRVFKDYYPDVIVGDTIAGRASVFTHPNAEWSQHLSEIQAARFRRSQEGYHPEERSFRITRKGANGSRQTRSSVIPEVHTFSAHESSITLEEIEDVHDFVQKLEKIEPPNQLVAVIGDPLLQKFLQLRSSEDYQTRIDNWLLSFFEDQLKSPESSEAKVLDILNAILGYTQYTKVLPQACLEYLKAMLPSWNGVAGMNTIMDLLAYIPVSSFEELHTSIFLPFEESILLDPTPKSKLAILTFYTNLLTNWTITLPNSTTPLPVASAAFTSLATYTSTLSNVLATRSPDISTLSSILKFYETIGILISQPTLAPHIRIPVPPSQLIYLFHFTNSLNILDRLCALLSLYKTAFENARKLNPSQYPPEYVNEFNGFLMDICNCIWRSKAFNTGGPNALGCLLAPSITSQVDSYVQDLGTDLNLQSLFSLSFSPVFCRFSIGYVRALEDEREEEIESRHPGPVTQGSLKKLEKDGGVSLSWGDYRLGVLMALEAKGLKGVGELMYSTVKTLKASRDGRV